jgi:hypothetical protein
MKIKVCMAVAIACLAAASQSRAQYCELETIVAHSEGQGVSADFVSVDTRTCSLGIETRVHVESNLGSNYVSDTCGSGNNEVTTVTKEETNLVIVLVGVYDRCLATQLLSVRGVGEPEEFHISQNFRTANVLAVLEGTDENDQPVSIDIDLVWNGVGKKEQTGTHVNGSQGGAVRFRYASTGTIRDAVAAGSVLVDGVDMTPLMSTQGTIERNASREFTEYR